MHRICNAGAAALLVGLAASAASAQVSNVVISEVYGAGGAAAEGYNADYVELFNRSAAPVNITGWSVQIASASGTTWIPLAIPGAVTLQPRQHYLVRVTAESATGQNFAEDAPPSASVPGAFLVNGGGKVALVNNTTALTGNPACPFPASVVDFVGFGTASNREPCGVAGNNAPGHATTTATTRLSGGCQDSGNNLADFTAETATPQNSSVTSPLVREFTGTITPSTAPAQSGTQITISGWLRDCGSNVLGASVSADLSPLGGGTLTLLDNGLNGDAAAGDGRYTGRFNLPAGAQPGEATLTLSYTAGTSGNTTVAFGVGPVNDACTGAQNISADINGSSWSGSIQNTYAGPDIDVGTCNTDGANTRFGVWYRFTPAGSGVIRLTETGAQDVVYGFFTYTNAGNPCGTLQSLSCLAAETSTQQVTGGTEYYLLVGNQTAISTTAAPTDNIDLTIELLQAPANDTCASVTNSTLPINETIPSVAATDDIDVSCNSGSVGNAGVWHRFIAPADGVVGITESGSIDTIRAVFTGPNCGALTEVACADAEALNVPIVAGTQYWVLTAAWSTTRPTADYSIAIEVLAPPANDTCANAIQVNVASGDVSDNSDGRGALSDVGLSCNADAPMTIAGVWYRIQTPQFDGYTMTVRETSTADVASGLFSGTCAGLTEIGCSVAETATYTLAANSVYYLLLGADSGTTAPSIAYAVNLEFTTNQGPCCNGSTCTIAPGGACVAGGGTYLGDNNVCAPPAGTPQDFAGGAGFPIPDNSSNSSDIVVGGTSFPVGAVSVSIDITHTYLSDLVITLSNGAVTQIIHSGDAFNDDNVGGVYVLSDAGTQTIDSAAAASAATTLPPGTYKANTTGNTQVNLNEVFNAQPSTGTWTLTIQDDAGIDTGALNSWTLTLDMQGQNVCSGGPTPCEQADFNNSGNVDATDIFIFLDAWFAQNGMSGPNLSADTNNSGNVDATDIFIYLDLWFAQNGMAC